MQGKISKFQFRTFNEIVFVHANLHVQACSASTDCNAAMYAPPEITSFETKIGEHCPLAYFKCQGRRLSFPIPRLSATATTHENFRIEAILSRLLSPASPFNRFWREMEWNRRPIKGNKPVN